MDHFATFEGMLAGCIDAMFGDEHGGATSRLASAPAPSPEDVVFASLGFACEGARGSLLMLTGRETARAFEPVSTDRRSEDVECDVLGELANMLVGRIKNKLLSRGVVLLLGTPLTTIARMARVLSSNEPTASAWYRIELPTGALHVRFDACFEPGFALVNAPDSVRAGDEGDMLFF